VSRPTFAVVIPAYNASQLIAEALASVFAQTAAAAEVVVSDDGSTDDLETALKPFRDRITLLQNPHRGAAAARNAAVEAASSDFVVMLDADDVYEPERLDALADLAEARPDLDILATDLWYERDGSLAERFYDWTPFPTEHQRLAIIDRCFVACPAMRRERVLEIGGFDELPAIAPAEDWDLFLRLVLSGSEAGLVDRPLLRYRIRASSATGDRSRALWARVRVLEKARSRSDLRPGESDYLDSRLRRARTRAILSDAATLTASRPDDFRRALLRLALTAGLEAPARAAVAAGAVAPAAGRHLLRRADRRIAGKTAGPRV